MEFIENVQFLYKLLPLALKIILLDLDLYFESFKIKFPT